MSVLHDFPKHNPVLHISRQLIETMTAHQRFTPETAQTRAAALLGRMGIADPERALDSWPHQFSGGMRQRVMLATGFANEPSLILADEPTTALDVTMPSRSRNVTTLICQIEHKRHRFWPTASEASSKG